MRSIYLLVTAISLLFSAPLSAAGLLVKSGESIAFLGDSITAQGAASPGGYVNLVASGLAAQGVTITVIPAGIGGQKSNQMLERLDRDVLDKKPTWMTLSCGVNDVWHGANGVPLEEYKTNIIAILDRCQAAGVKVLILTATQIKLPATNPENVKLAAYNAFLRETAVARQLPLADLNAAMAAEQTALERTGIKRVLTVDGVHMNLYGNIMMAKGVLAAFGLDQTQLAAANASWAQQPDLYQTNAKIKLSLGELAALEAVAAKQNMSAEALIAELTTAAVKTALTAGK